MLEHLLGDHKLVPDMDLTEADTSALAARHELAHDDAYEGHEPPQLTSNPTVKPAAMAAPREMMA